GLSVGLEVRIEKGLPLAGGMGGSAASAVAGAVAADAILGSNLGSDALLEAALEAEAGGGGRPPDNLAPSRPGRALLLLGLDPPQVARIQVHPGLALVLATPAYGVETAAARAVLPKDVSRHDAVLQAACLGSLVLGLERGDASLIRGALFDRIAEPPRRHLYP